MLDSTVERPVSRETVIRAATATPERRINPALIFPIVSLLENAIIALTGLVAFLRIGNSNKSSELIIILLGVAILSLNLLRSQKLKNSPERVLKSSLLRRLLLPLLSIPFPISIAAFFVAILEQPQDDIANYFFLGQSLWYWTALSTVAVVIIHISIWYVLRRWHARGVLVQAIAIVGAGEHSDRLVRWLNHAYPLSIEIVGVFDDRQRERAAQLPLRHLLRGTVDDLLRVPQHMQIDRVLVALPHAAEERLLQILRKLRRLPADITLAPDLIAFAMAEESGPKVCPLPLFDVFARPLKMGEELGKTIFDRVVAAGLILLFLPVILIIVLAISLDSPGPILFRQARYGLGHQIITVLKFRTMYSELSDPGCFRQTEVGDPRTTRVGRWLRRMSLDELPQLFNVLRGDMSLVGPRPLATEMRVEDKLNHDLVSEYCLRHRIKPGITGWAQIHGHRGAINSRESLEQRILYDLYYIDNWSFWLDMRILVLTGTTIFSARNAY